jgi:NTE family protein
MTADDAPAPTTRPPPDAAPPRVGLVLSGGGARAAYQVGVLKAVAELVPPNAPLPFRVISGTSAGAIIGALVASHAAQFRAGVFTIERFWRNFAVEQVLRADAPSMLRAGAHWLLALLSGGALVAPPRSLFDNSPLRELLERHVNFARIRQHLEHGYLDALAVTASSYRSARSVTFADCGPRATDAPEAAVELSLDHVMASSAVPFLFPAVCIDGEYYGDGAMRQLAPLSPAIRHGAERLLVIGVRAPSDSPGHDVPGGGVIPLAPHGLPRPPSFGQIFGFMLDMLFADGVQSDLERLHRENALLAVGAAPGRRHIDALCIAPSVDFGLIAARHAAEVPRTLAVLLRTMGAGNDGGRTLLSYLLFSGGFARELIDLGYRDGLARSAEIQVLLSPP